MSLTMLPAPRVCVDLSALFPSTSQSRKAPIPGFSAAQIMHSKGYSRCNIRVHNSFTTQTLCMATQYASAPCKLTISSYLFTRWHLLRHVGYLRHQQQVDLWPFDLESGVRVSCDVGYLCANFSLTRPLCARVRHDVCDRHQTKASLIMLPPYGGGGIISGA